MLRRRWVWGLAILLTVHLRGPARAGEEDDRRRLIDEIESTLREVAGDLDGLAGDSSSSDVDRALDRTSRVRDKLRDLERVQGDDSKAREMVSRYPGYIDKFREAAQALKQLKDGQRSLDEQPRRCQDKTRELADKIRSYVDKNDPDGVTEIPRLAKEYGRPVAEMLSRAERQKDEYGRLRDRARYFSESDGRWSDVRSELHDAASEIFDQWNRRYDETRKECEELAKEERARAVEDAIRKLTEGANGRQILIKELTQEVAETVPLVTDVEADSSDSDVKSAARNADDMKRLLDRLRSAQGEDKRAKEIAEKWPREVDAMNTALMMVDDMKDLQTLTDRAPERCKTEDEKIVRAADALERLDAESDLSSVERAEDELESTLRTAREGLLEALRKAAEARSNMESLQSRAKGAWSAGVSELKPIDEELDESADDIAKHYASSHEAAKTRCAAPSSGGSHPAAKKARTKMFGDCTKDQFRSLRQPVTEYCKQQLRACSSSDSKRELDDKTEIFKKCIKARENLRDTCYSRARDSHDKEIGTLEIGKQKCIDLAKAAGS